MSLTEQDLRQQISDFGRSLFNRGLSAGSSGNISVRLDDGWLMTPTNCCLGNLDPADISRLDAQGNLLSGKKPSKEFFLHAAFLAQRPQDKAVVHLHSTYATAVACLAGYDAHNMLPALTPLFDYASWASGLNALSPTGRPAFGRGNRAGCRQASLCAVGQSRAHRCRANLDSGGLCRRRVGRDRQTVHHPDESSTAPAHPGTD